MTSHVTSDQPQHVIPEFPVPVPAPAPAFAAPASAVPASASRPGPRRRAGRTAALVGLVAFGLVAAGCGGGPGTREELIDVVSQDGAFSVEQATCIADAVFERYGDDDDALGKISAADSFEFFDGEDGVPGFSSFFDQTVQSCAPVGPTSG